MDQYIGKYLVEGVLGTGAMGVVYRARDPHIQRTVAIKTVRKELLDDEARGMLMDRFRTEAQAAGRLTHPNIVAVYDFGEDDANSFIVMEYVAGKPLSAFIQDGIPIGPALTRQWMTALLEALDFAHRHGVVHRDIKPANLLVTAQGRLKVTDFGVARLDAGASSKMGTVVGTPTHMAPEQFLGTKIDHRADVFASGVVLYQLLTGYRPFDGPPGEVMHGILSRDPIPPSQRNATLSAEFDAVVARALAKKPDDRYPDAGQFLAALNRALGGGPEAEPRTVIMPQTPGMPTPPVTAGSATGEPATEFVQRASGFSAEILAAAEQALARSIGPLARVLVKKEALKAADLEALWDALESHVPPGPGRVELRHALDDLRTRYAPPTPPAASQGGTAASGDAASWASETLTGVELALAKSIGPVARVLVKKAATQAADLDTLAHVLAQQVPDGPDRTAFHKALEDLRRRTGGATTGSGTARAIASAAVAPPPQAGVSPRAAADAEARLLAYLGPIAKVLVKRALRDAKTDREFHLILAENIPDDGPRRKYLREVGAGE